MRPMLDVLLLWVFMTLGGFCGSVGIMAVVAAEIEDMPIDHPTRVLIVAMTVAAPLFFVGTWTMWRRLNGPRPAAQRVPESQEPDV